MNREKELGKGSTWWEMQEPVGTQPFYSIFKNVVLTILGRQEALL